MPKSSDFLKFGKHPSSAINYRGKARKRPNAPKVTKISVAIRNPGNRSGKGKKTTICPKSRKTPSMPRNHRGEAKNGNLPQIEKHPLSARNHRGKGQKTTTRPQSHKNLGRQLSDFFRRRQRSAGRMNRLGLIGPARRRK